MSNMEEPFIGGDEFAHLQKYPAKVLTDALRQDIEADPYYFVYQGGSDGTLAHAEFLGKYGEWEPAASDYAAEFLTKKGLDW